MNYFVLGVIGPTEIILIVAIVLLLFGGRKIPELMKGIGRGVREFKEGMSGASETKKESADPEKKDNQ
jgi:sec-independent protein translocase protein TatA